MAGGFRSLLIGVDGSREARQAVVGTIASRHGDAGVNEVLRLVTADGLVS